MWLGEQQAGMDTDRAEINAALERLLGAPSGGPVGEAMHYAALGPGQRIRPILSLRIARALDSWSPSVLRAALAVELLHAASLIVDDLPCMDDAATRRGRATVHRAYGEPIAILAAFGLVALAARSVMDPPAFRTEQMIAFQRRLLDTLDVSALLGGQAMDLGLSGSVADPALVTELKTAPLFELAARAGTIGADLTQEEARALHQFGRDFGTAFQFVDDVIDGDRTHVQPVRDRLASLRLTLTPFRERAYELLALVNYLDARLHSSHGDGAAHDATAGLRDRAA